IDYAHALASPPGSLFPFGDVTPRSVNNLGDVTGWGWNLLDQQLHAFIWTDFNLNGFTDPGNDLIPGSGDLVDLGPGWARSINDYGLAVGQALLPSGALHAYRWSRGGGRFDLGTLPGGA